MRNTEEQLREIRMRSEKLKQKQKDRKAVATGCISICACIAMIVAASLSLPSFKTSAATHSVKYGSLVISTPHLGYVVIGILAFLLGICVTLLCVRLRGDKSGWDK